MVVDAGLHENTCLISTTDAEPGSTAIFTFNFSDPVTEATTLVVSVNGENKTTTILAGQSMTTLNVPVSSDFSGTITAELVSVTGVSGVVRTPSSNKAVCYVKAKKRANLTVTAESENVATGQDMSFRVTVSEPALADMTVNMSISKNNGSASTYSVNIPKGDTQAVVTINEAQPGNWRATISGFSGGGFDEVTYASASASCTVKSNVDALLTFSISSSAPWTSEKLKLNFELTAASALDLTITVEVWAAEVGTSAFYSYDVTYVIPAGEKSKTFTVSYGDGILGGTYIGGITEYSLRLASTEGGDYHSLIFDSYTSHTYQWQ